MPSRTHTHGEPQGVSDVLRRDLRGVLERNRQQTADNRWADYVRPIGNDRHLVRNFDNSQVYVVGSAFPGISFAPGSSVILASNTGQPGEIVIGMPSADRRGGFTHPVVRFKPPHSEADGLPQVPSAPADAVGDLWAFHQSGSHIWCWIASGTDGSVVETKADIAIPKDVDTFSVACQFFGSDPAGNMTGPILTWREEESAGASWAVRPSYVWDIGSNTLHTIVLDYTDAGSPSAFVAGVPFLSSVGGGDVYIPAFNNDFLGAGQRSALYKHRYDGTGSTTLVGYPPRTASSSGANPPLFFVSDITFTSFFASGPIICQIPLNGVGGVGTDIAADGMFIGGNLVTLRGPMHPYVSTFGGKAHFNSIGRWSGTSNKWRQVLFEDDLAGTLTSSDRWVTFGTDFIGNFLMMSINYDKDTLGTFDYSVAATETFKYSQPLGASGDTGHTDDTPNVTIANDGGRAAHAVFLGSYSHSW